MIICSVVKCDVCGNTVPIGCAKVIASEGQCRCMDCRGEGVKK